MGKNQGYSKDNARLRLINGGRHFRQLCGLLLTIAMLMSIITIAAAAPPPSTKPVVFEAVYNGDAEIIGIGEPGALVEVYEEGAATPIGSTTVDPEGYWQVTLSPSFATTANALEIFQTEASLGVSAAANVAVKADAGDNRYLVLPRDSGGLAIPGVAPKSVTYATTSTAIASIVPVSGVDYNARERDSSNIGYDFASISAPLYTTGNIIIFEAQYIASASTYYKATIDKINGVDTVEDYYEENDVVNISAGTYTDYEFYSWATSPNTIVFTTGNDALSANTSFYMPGVDATVTARWIYIGATPGGPGTSGGGGGGGSPPVPTEPSDKQDADKTGGDGEEEGDEGDEGMDTGTGLVTPNLKLLPRFEMGFEDGFVPLGVFNPNHIAYLYGYEEGDVKPDAYITRSEASALLFRILSDPDRFKHLDNTFEFADWEWYYEPVTYLTSIGIIKGYEDGSFRADDNITRAEFITMVSRFGITEGPMSLELSDIAGHWAEEYIHIGVTNGWISGYSDGTFKPDNSITRAEVVSVLNRLLYRGVELGDIPSWAPEFTDIDESHWAYGDIIEAATGHEFERKDNGYEIWTGPLD